MRSMVNLFTRHANVLCVMAWLGGGCLHRKIEQQGESTAHWNPSFVKGARCSEQTESFAACRLAEIVSMFTTGCLPQVVSSTRRLTEGHLPQGRSWWVMLVNTFSKGQLLEVVYWGQLLEVVYWSITEVIYRYGFWSSKIIYKVDCCVLWFFVRPKFTDNYRVATS